MMLHRPRSALRVVLGLQQPPWTLAGAAVPGDQHLSLCLRGESSFGRCWSFDLRCVLTKPKPVVLSLPRVVVRLIWSVQTLDNAAMTANVRGSRPAPVPSLAGNAGSPSATCDPSNGGVRCGRAPLLVFRPALRFHEAKTCRFGFGESRRSADLVGADPRRRCDDRKRLGVATCTRSQPRRNCRVLQRDLRALHGGAGEPAVVGLSTCAAYSGDQNLSFGLWRESLFALFGGCRPSMTLR